MPSVRVKENEYFDAAMRRFKRACEKAGILTELRRREHYEKPTQKARKGSGRQTARQAPVPGYNPAQTSVLISRPSRFLKCPR